MGQVRTRVMRYFRSFALIAAVVIAGCTGGTAADDAGSASPSESAASAVAPGDGDGDEAAAVVVDIIDFAFEPDNLEVPTGTTVEWVQQDSSRHTVDFTDGEESGELEEGDTYRRTFSEAGTYDYVCFFHPQMTATVTVTE